MTQKTVQMSIFRYTDDWHSSHPSRMSILCIPPRSIWICFFLYLITVRVSDASATNHSSVRNTRVFQTSLTAPTEPGTLWRRITLYASLRQWVMLHANPVLAIVPPLLSSWHMVLYITPSTLLHHTRSPNIVFPWFRVRNLVSYRHHPNNTYVTLFAANPILLLPFKQCLAMYMPFSSRVPHCTCPQSLLIGCHTLPLYMCSLEVLPLITIQSSLRIHWLPLDLFHHYHIYRSEIYCPIFTLPSTMPSLVQILCWSNIGLWCLFLVIHIRIATVIAFIPVDTTGSQVYLLEFSRGPSLPSDSGDGIALLIFVTIIFIIPTAPWHREMQLIIRAIVAYRDVWVSASDSKCLKRHFRGQIVKKNGIANTRLFCAEDHNRRWVLPLLDFMLDCSQSVFIHHQLVALR